MYDWVLIYYNNDAMYFILKKWVSDVTQIDWAVIILRIYIFVLFIILMLFIDVLFITLIL